MGCKMKEKKNLIFFFLCGGSEMPAVTVLNQLMTITVITSLLTICRCYTESDICDGDLKCLPFRICMHV